MSEEQVEKVRRTVFFSGGVQGVGFRCTAEAVASQFPVTGFVRNLPDGRVELVAEGTQKDLVRFERAVRDAMRSNISHVSAIDGPGTGEFRSFRITL